MGNYYTQPKEEQLNVKNGNIILNHKNQFLESNKKRNRKSE